ncbi:MAG TPA: ATP-binding protein, partial [Aestuariivirgaceae bacterium]|nr:ATP-binding protein [Aestuariivirgaceae bacterium]
REDHSSFASKVADQAQLMRDQIGHYLDRARMAARAGAIGRVTPVEATAEPLVRAIERLHGEKGIAIACAIQPGAKFQGEKQDLEEMLGNLLDNAFKWAKRRISVEVTAARGETAGRHWLSVKVGDDGPGLPEDRREEALKRGRRLDETKPGSGLGLNIVNETAAMYGGSVNLERSVLGGLMATLRLPAV